MPRYVLTVEPETLSFTARQGGLPPIARYLTLSSSGLVDWAAAADVPWLAFTPVVGGVPQSVLVSPDNRGLVLGSYFGSVSFAAPKASNAPVRTVVRLDIVARAPLAGRWLAVWDLIVFTLDLRDSPTGVAGTGLLVVGSTPFTVTGTRTGGDVALTFQPPSGAPLVFNSFFATDHVMRGLLTGPGFPGDSVVMFRQ